MLGCASSTPVVRYGESESRFSNPPELMSHEYPAIDIYRTYKRGSNGLTSIQSLRNDVEMRASKFAQQQGKSFVVLGEQTSNPPYLFGNFPRIEIVFALINKEGDKKPTSVTGYDKYAELEKLKKLLDNGTLTQAEFEIEKNKILK